MENIKKDNQGMIIVFTLILLAVFLTTALSFSYFIIGDINKARAIDDSVIAYYAADAGLEESLYLLKNQELAGDLNELKVLRGQGQSEERKLASSTGVWDISDSTNYEKTTLRQRLYNGQSAKFFILNRDSGNETKSITVEWYKGPERTPKLQVNLTQLTSQMSSSTLVYYMDTSVLEIADSAFNGQGAQCFNLKDLNLAGENIISPLPDYLVEFKVLGGAGDFIDRLFVKAYSNVCGVAEAEIIPNPEGITNLTLKSHGTYGKSTQNIIAHILPRDPVSGILSFVLFSEEDVTKE